MLYFYFQIRAICSLTSIHHVQIRAICSVTSMHHFQIRAICSSRLYTTSRLEPSVPSHLCTTSRLEPSVPSRLCTTSRLEPSVPSRLCTTSRLEPSVPSHLCTTSRLEPSVPSRLYTTDTKSEVGRFSSGNSRIPQRHERRQSTQGRLPQINPTSVINSDRRASRKINKDELNLNTSRVLPDIKRGTIGATTRTKNESSKTLNPRKVVLSDIRTHTKAATTSRRRSCHKTIHDSTQDEPDPDKSPSLSETTKKYQKNKVYGTSSWRQDVKPTRAKETTNSATRGKTLITKRGKNKTTQKGCKVPANQVLSDIDEGRELRAQSSLDHILDQLEFDGDVIYRSDTQLGEAGSEYDPVIDTPRPASPVDYSFKTILSLDPNRKIPSRIPMLTGDLSKLIPPRAPVYPHPLRYFAGELIQKEYLKAGRLTSAQQTIDDNIIDTSHELSPRRPLDPFEQTMLELKRPSSAYSKLSFRRKQPERASADVKLEGGSVPDKPHLHRMASRPQPTRKADTSKADWWINELEICRQTCHELHQEVPGCHELHQEVPGCTSTVACSGDVQTIPDIDTTNAEQVCKFFTCRKTIFNMKMSL